MSIEALRLPSEVAVTRDDDELEHYYCGCSPNLALCGTDVTDTDDVTGLPYTDETCVVCMDLIDAACRFCGES